MQIMLHESDSIHCSSNSLTLWARCFSKGGISWEPSKGLVLCLPSNPNPYVVYKQVNSQNYVCKRVKVASCVGIMCENHDM